MFETSLSITLELTVEQTTVSIVSGNIKNLSFDYRSDGFDASLDFWIICQKDQSEDELFASFAAKDLMTAKLTIDRTYDTVGESADSLALSGLVVHKQVTERAFPGLAGEPILHRHYHVKIADRGRALWSQHYPTSLYVDKSLQQLIDDNKPAGVSVTYSWSGASGAHPVLALGLGAPENRASFHDFLCWLCDRENALLVYDAGTGGYDLAGQKKNLSGAEVAFVREDVLAIKTFFPEVERASVTVLNGSTQTSSTTKPITNSQSVTGIKRNYLIVSSLSANIDTRATLETARHKLKEHETHVTFARYPSVTLKPNQLMSFDDNFSANIHQNGKEYRLERVLMTAHASSQEATDEVDEEVNHYHAECTCFLELKTDVALRPRPFITPHWPFFVEGKIVSDQGAEGEATHQAYVDSQTSIESYKVKIPLFANQKVIAPYDANLLAGHFYFPAYRDARVLVGFELERAFIVRFIDWRAGSRLPQDTQGNSIQFGKKTADGSAISHVYKEQKPVFAIQRIKDKDNQSITISDGTILLSTEEKP